ncbi:ABC transporter permease [Dyadobacter arcticus]|uniref:ABC-type antimicrobial peptide transport system permease subunit n=1 Tax=Dyadobacter arcticus TaxID=1078754 RepID=A0ABX0USZ5_9BACT|nr:ABC transporter permease [Dyadobacter arcticus]NIJ55044.1 ABC-type antimicrobial peptide transport system permease subunit [Dyadobacter arcticus]
MEKDQTKPPGWKPPGRKPPEWIDKLLKTFIAPHFREDVMGDLHEVFAIETKSKGPRKARFFYLLAALSYMQPYFIKRKPSPYSSTYLFSPEMIKNYFKIALRTLVKNKAYSFINIAGLAMGMAVAMLIGLWIYDELSYDKSFKNHGRIVQVMQHQTSNGITYTQAAIPYPLGNELRSKYGSDFKHLLMSSWTSPHILAFGDIKVRKSGNYIEPAAPEMLTLKMLAGTWAGLKEPNSIMISRSVADALFGEADPMEKVIKMDNSQNVKVTGVYEDLPYNSSFRDLTFVAPWSLYEIENPSIKTMEDPWRPNNFQIFAQLNAQADVDKVSARIKDVKKKNIRTEQLKFKPDVFVNPMDKWYLYSTFKNGHRIGGRIENVWLFGMIGAFVLLLACINFMNLSTARSEKRAREVGIRKAVGSVRNQLVTQFLSESLLVVAFAFAFSLLLVLLMLPFFNEVADKKLEILWTSPVFWMLGLGFTLVTAFIAGSYPALYLSSFQPIKVLKGTYKAGRFAAIPRQALVIVQFTVSIVLIIGTTVVFRQIQFAKNRPVGYSKEGLVTVYLWTPEIHKHFEVVRQELKSNNAIIEMSESNSPATNNWASTSGIVWKDKDPSLSTDFSYNNVSYEYAETIGWKFTDGRNFSRDFASDSSGLVVNEAAVKFMDLKNPVGENLTWFGTPVKIIGVVKDMIVDSPYEPVRPLVYSLANDMGGVISLRINPRLSGSAALQKIESIFKKYDPAIPFEAHFVDQDYDRKFYDEVRIAKLTSFFSALAILISCLGLFGVASFVAEQRTKEIGVRKVLGATVLNVWGMLSRDFVILVCIAFVIAAPVSYYFLNGWLEKFQYRTEISFWIFILTGLGTLLITLLTVSFQAIKAALMNPIKSLRSE